MIKIPLFTAHIQYYTESKNHPLQYCPKLHQNDRFSKLVQ